MNNKFVKGIIIVSIASASYGVVAVIVKLASEAGHSIAELTFSQVIVGFLTIALMNLLKRTTSPTDSIRKVPKKTKWKLILGGIPFGLTSTFYYLSLTHTSVSVCIVMLMQSVWIGSVIDYFVNKEKPSRNKVIAIIVVLIGTVLATNLLASDATMDWQGIFWGLLAALSYSLSLLVTNNVGSSYPPLKRSMYILMGSATTITLIWGYSLYQHFDVSTLWTWGILIALFGTILPPLLFTKGMPIIGVGLGSILASIELPVSVLMARFILHEEVVLAQWAGIILILSAVIIMNISYLKPSKSD